MSLLMNFLIKKKMKMKNGNRKLLSKKRWNRNMKFFVTGQITENTMKHAEP